MMSVRDRGVAARLAGSLHEEQDMVELRNKPQHDEGRVARMIEEQTAKLPSDIFLWAAAGSIATALAFQLTGRKENAQFVGQWAPTFLILGLYNKIVKVMGHD